MEQVSSGDSQNRLLQLLTNQNEMIAKILEKQNSTMENMLEEHIARIDEQNSRIHAQNTRIEALTMAVKTLVENSSSISELVSSMKSQNDGMKEQNARFEEQNENFKGLISAVKTLEKNSILDHDDKPFPQHDLYIHEPGWRAVFETLTAKMKNQVERWRNGMDSTLIFVALFVTVITAFQIPVSQNLSPNPADLTNNILGNLTTMVYEIVMLNGLKVHGGLPRPEPFRPDRTDQVVTLFWYTALLLSLKLITAILSVFGRQWVEHLTKKPDGKSYKEKSWRLDFREKLAEKLLRPLLDSLHPILIVSIILFIVGLLFQLWSISFSVDKPFMLILTSSVGTALIVCTAAVTIYTLVHGVYWEESPFTTSTSLGIRRQLVHRHIKAVSKVDDEVDLYSLFCSAMKQMGETHHFDQASTVPFSDLLKSKDIHDIELAVDAIVTILGSDASLKAKQTIAWNLCSSYWQIRDEIRLGAHEKSIECHGRLFSALQSAYRDTSFSQKKVSMTFFIVRLAILLRFSGVDIYLEEFETKELKKVFFETFKLDRRNCIEESYFESAKYDAIHKYYVLAEEHPHLFDEIFNDANLLLAFVSDSNDVGDYWKHFLLRYSAKEENVTNILRLISTESLKKDARCSILIHTLFTVLKNSKLPFILPANFDISNLIKCATSDAQRLANDYPYFSYYEYSPVDVLLSWLSLMDESLLDAQQGLLDFLDWVDEHGYRIKTIRDEIPLSSSSVIELRDRLPSVSPLPLSDVSFLAMDFVNGPISSTTTMKSGTSLNIAHRRMTVKS